MTGNFHQIAQFDTPVLEEKSSLDVEAGYAKPVSCLDAEPLTPMSSAGVTVEMNPCMPKIPLTKIEHWDVIWADEMSPSTAVDHTVIHSVSARASRAKALARYVRHTGTSSLSILRCR